MRVSTDVLTVLDRATCQGNALSLAAVGQLDRKLYTDTNKVLEAAGGKWNRKVRAHLFDGDAAEAIEPIILTGEIVSRKVEFQQFDTPPDLAARVIAEARIEPGMQVLEPSAGKGALALPALATGAFVMCIESDLKRCKSLIERSKKPNSQLSVIAPSDFLLEPPISLYDRVVMNPPFAGQADIRHVMHAAKFLIHSSHPWGNRAAGRLVAIMSASIRFRQNRLADEFRAFLEQHQAVIEDLPDRSFKASGTNVNACLVSFDREAA